MNIEFVVLAIVGVVLMIVLTSKPEAPQYELQGKTEDYLADAIKSFNENHLRFAEKSYKLALIKAKQSAADDRIFGRILLGLGTVYAAQGRYPDAEAMMQEARKMYEAEYGAEDLRVASVLSHIGQLYQKQDRLEDAKQAFSRCIEMQEAALGPDHPEVLRTATALGSLYFTMSSYDLAEEWYTRSLSSQMRALKPISKEQMKEYQNLIVIYKMTDRPSEAIDLEDRLRKMPIAS